MMYGINLNPVLPVRRNAEEQSEMTSQLLFGELFVIESQNGSWSFICNKTDHYKGWIDTKMIAPLNEKEYLFYANCTSKRITSPVCACLIKNKNEQIILPAGSILYEYSQQKAHIIVQNRTYLIPGEYTNANDTDSPSGENIIRLAKQFLNAPYLWGGKSIFGIDCSGFVQLIYSLVNIDLNRDASQQIKQGKAIDFLQESESGDLAFFENNEGKICHVGILINSSTIIHASGRVKIEGIDNMGIFNENGKYTHRLRLIKRILPENITATSDLHQN